MKGDIGGFSVRTASDESAQMDALTFLCSLAVYTLGWLVPSPPPPTGQSLSHLVGALEVMDEMGQALRLDLKPSKDCGRGQPRQEMETWSSWICCSAPCGVRCPYDRNAAALPRRRRRPPGGGRRRHTGAAAGGRGQAGIHCAGMLLGSHLLALFGPLRLRPLQRYQRHRDQLQRYQR
jgi:hypothetical protein